MAWGEPVLTDRQREDAAYYGDLLRHVYGGRRWIVTAEVMVGASRHADTLLEHGASDVMTLAVIAGTGAWNEERPHAWLRDLGAGATTIVEGIRAYDAALADPGDEALAAIAAFDPDGTAAIVPGFLGTEAEVAGRRTFGARRPEWVALEDKLTVDALWDAVGVPRAPSRNVALAATDDLARATRDLDRGDGTVWVADNSSGWHGGGEYARIVRSASDAEAAVADLRGAALEVRVMPFLEGIPCSIHGMVFRDRTIAFRPCEMVVFRDRAIRGFRYGQAATTWDPRPADRDAMRQMAVRVGDHLRETVDYRGVFTIDGVMTTEGFRPTELNPRFGGALLKLSLAAKLPMLALHAAVAEGADLDWQPQRLERLVIEVADANRSAGGGMVVPGSVDATETLALRWTGSTFDVASGDEDAEGEVALGPTRSGRFVMTNFDPAIVPEGHSAAPYVADVLRLADRRWDLGLPDLESAVDVQRT